MHVIHGEKLLRLIKIIPPFIVTAFACLTIFIVISHNNAQLSADIQTLKQDFIASEKELIKAQVKQLIQQITYERDSTETILKNNIKEHIYQAHAIASNIYENNINKSENEVTKLIYDALRDIRFNDGRGYFFIYKTNGVSVMHPVIPKMEGSSKANFQDVKGSYIVRDLGQLAKEHGESFYHWWFVKPDNKEQEFEKIGFGKHFEPYDWFIGTGEYLIDVENDIKQRMVRRISNMKFGTNGYIFILDHQGNVISHYRKYYEGTNLYDNADEHVVTSGTQIIEKAKQGGGYLNYVSPVMPSTGETAQKISYINSFPQWDWIIGTGFYKSETDVYLANRERKIAQQNEKELFRLFGLGLFVTLFFISLSLFLTRYLGRRFTIYEDKINTTQQQLQLLNEQLEHKVVERTVELEEKNKEILATQKQLIQSSKMASIGTMTAGVAHEINNPTNFAHAAVYMMSDEISKIKSFLKKLAGGENAEPEVLQSFDDKFNKLIDLTKTATEGTTRIKTIVDNLRAFARIDDAKQATVKLSGLLKSTVHLVSTQYDSILIETHFDYDPMFTCFPSKLNQVFMNIIVNACQAIEIKQLDYKELEGKIIIKTAQKNNKLVFTFEDNGCGMTEENIPRIFEPFFTTKDVGKGTGLGMAISFGIIEEHSGSVEVKSIIDEGSKIIIRFDL